MTIEKTSTSKKRRQLHRLQRRRREYKHPHFRPAGHLRQQWRDVGDIHAAMLIGFYAYYGVYAKKDQEYGANFWQEAFAVADRMPKDTFAQKRAFSDLAFYVALAQLDGLGEHRSLIGRPFVGFKLLRRAIRLGSPVAAHWYRIYAHDYYLWSKIPKSIVAGFKKKRNMMRFIIWVPKHLIWAVTFSLMPLVDRPLQLRRG